MNFPINTQHDIGIPINAHPGAFGNARKHNFHEGVDLYGHEGMWVHAINPGVVVSNERFTGPSVGCPWWLETDAVIVRSDTEYFVYGELKSDLVVGDEVKSGSLIGQLVPVLPSEKIRPDIPGHSNVMLHLEKWNFDYPGKWKETDRYGNKVTYSNWETRERRPEWLEDPTADLIDILIEKYRKVKFLTL